MPDEQEQVAARAPEPRYLSGPGASWCQNFGVGFRDTH
jgi:hypothetical protein